MTVQFDSDCSRAIINKIEPCLCAQMASCFGDFLKGKDTFECRIELKENANSDCPFCNGIGIEKVETDDAPILDLANRNAEVLFKILGVDQNKGELTMPEARRAIIRAKSRKSLEEFVIPEEKKHGPPREIEPGIFKMKPIKYWDIGLSEEKLEDYINRFAEFVIEVSKRGATKIIWY